MAEKKGKKKQNTAYHKEANAEFQKGAGNAFTGGGNAAYQPRDSGIGKPGRGSGGKRQTEKSMLAQQETFGQKVQKSDAKPGQEEKTDFVKESSGFTGQENFNQTEDREKQQPDAEDYHRRDTYRQSQKKGKYHKKRVQREHRNKGGTKEKAENKTFTYKMSRPNAQKILY